MNQKDNAEGRMEDLNSTSFETDDGIGIITLHSPPFNILHNPCFIALSELTKLISDQSVRGLIITGAGKNFSIGGDLEKIRSFAEQTGELERMLTNGKHLLTAIEHLEIPVIAAINRVCFGGGLEIALACHIRVASENALLAFPEVNQNLIPGLDGTVRLSSMVSKAHSMQIILGGDTINAFQAKELGLIDYIAPKDCAMDFSRKLMKKMTWGRPVNVINAIMKALINSETLSPEHAGMEETKLFCELARAENKRRKTEGESSW